MKWGKFTDYGLDKANSLLIHKINNQLANKIVNRDCLDSVVNYLVKTPIRTHSLSTGAFVM